MRIYYNSATPPAETWVRVSAVVSFPDITTRNNSYGYCSVILRDYEGALFAAWEARDLIEMKVTDDAGTPNTLFRGYLMNKKFHAKDLVLELAGFGIMLYRRSFGSEEIKNYILANGYPKTLNANSQIDLWQSDGEGGFEDFDWEDEKWVKGDIDVGLMIKDTTKDENSTYWDCKDPIAQVGGVVQGGTTFIDTHTFNDGDYYTVKDDSDSCDLVVTATMDGAAIAKPPANYLKRIEIEYNFAVAVFVTAQTDVVCYLEINKDGSWKPIAELPWGSDWEGFYTSGWCQALPDSLKEGSSPFIIDESQTADPAAELAKYFTSNGNYDSVDLRIRCEGQALSTSYITLYIDYLRVKVVYHTDDVLPVMHRITDSGLDGAVRWVECSEVSDWSAMGITENVDAFQIGENTRQVIQDIMGEAGLKYEIVDGFDNSFIYDTNYPTGDTATIEWDTTGGNHFGELDDANDATYVSTNANTETEIYTLDDINNLFGGYINKIEIKIRAKVSIQEGQQLNFCYSTDGGATWSDPQNTSTNITDAWGWHTLTFSSLEIYGMDGFQIKMYNGFFVMGGTVYVSELYVKLTLSTSNFDKYMARKFKGQHCIEPLKAVCALEGAEWMEDYINNRIKIIKKADFESSGVSITQAEYDHDWEYEDLCNEVKYIYVWGKTSFDNVAKTTTNIFAKAVSLVASGENSKQIVDDNIFTIPEAKTVAKKQLALLEVKRPSIRIPMNGVQADIQMGTTVNITLVRPTVGAADYPIRMIQRSRFGKTGIKTIVYAGFGETKWDEKIIKEIERIGLDARKALSDRLTSTPYDVGIGGIAWGDVGGADAGARAAAVSDAVYAAGWDGVTTIAASKNAVYDKINAMSGSIWTEVAASNYWRYGDSFIYMQVGYTNANLQAAIDDLVDNYEGGIIYLPTGDCTITSQLIVDGSSISIIGSGFETNLINGLTADYIMDITGNYSTVKDLKVTTSATADHGIEMSGSYNILDNLYIVGVHDNGNDVGITGGNNNIIKNCVLSSNNYGVYVNAGVHHIIHNNKIVDTDEGIYINAVNQTLCYGNTFEAIDGYSIYVVADYCRIFGNCVGTGSGIYIHANAAWTGVVGNLYPAISNNGSNTTISGNSDY